MPQVDFYVVDTGTELGRRHFVCRLLEKIQKLDKTVVILMPDDEAVQAMDRLLWDFPPESFLPHHASQGAEGGEESNIEITAADWKSVRDVAINLRLEPVTRPEQCDRLVEIVAKDDARILAASRRHYAYYRKLGYPIQSHTIGGV